MKNRFKPIKFNRSKIKKVELIKNEHSRTSKRIIMFVIVAIFVFTGLAIWTQVKTGMELSPTLITCFFTFCTGELWMLASIKKSKLKTGQKDNQYKIMDYGQHNVNDDDDDEPVG
jgi:hypothetical protein